VLSLQFHVKEDEADHLTFDNAGAGDQVDRCDGTGRTAGTFQFDTLITESRGLHPIPLSYTAITRSK